MNEQPELDFSRQAAGKWEELLAALVAELRGQGWVTAAALARKGWSDRVLRRVCEADVQGLIFSAPGTRGYKLLVETTPEEFRQNAALRSQARQMNRKFIRQWRAWLRLGRAQPL